MVSRSRLAGRRGMVPAVHGRAPRVARSGPPERRSAARGRGLRAGGTIAGSGRGQALFLLVGLPAQTVALEFDAVSIMDDAVQNGVAEGRVRDNVVPLRHGHLTCDQERSFVVAIVADLWQAAGLVACTCLR